MRKRTAYQSLLVLLVVCGCNGEFSTEITIPNSAVQTGLDSWMPVVLNDYVDQVLPATVTLEKTEVIASDGSDRIGVKMHLKTVLHEINPHKVFESAEAKLADKVPPGFPGPLKQTPLVKPFEGRTDAASEEKSPRDSVVDEILGHVTARVGIRYEAATSEFFCQDAEAEEVVFENLPLKLKEPVKRLCEEALNKYFSENSVYTLSGEDATMTLAKSTLKNVSIRDGNLVVELGFSAAED